MKWILMYTFCIPFESLTLNKNPTLTKFRTPENYAYRVLNDKGWNVKSLVVLRFYIF